ncbi:hypothetical protein EDD15DRAFT_2197843 [Pisolithus albus]|nr:hypothetical protein EDD15DRAFT_2197843 [Pisolithus albus]
MTQLLEQGKGRRSRAMCRVTGYLPDGVRNTLDNLTPEGRVAVDSAFFEGELSECEDIKGNQPRCTDQQFCCVWSDNIPCSAVSSDGTSLLHYLHKFLNHQLANEYYKTVTKYCKAAKPSMVLLQALLPMGSTMREKGKWQACFSWPDIGMQLGNPKRKLFEFVDYLQDTELLSHAIDRALHVIDPEFHEKLTHLREVVNQKFPA